MDQNFTVLEVFNFDRTWREGNFNASVFERLTAFFDFVGDKDMAEVLVPIMFEV